MRGGVVAFLRSYTFTPDDKRNFRLGLIMSVYGMAFAAEKAFIVFYEPVSDTAWLIVYGALASLATYWWLEDFIMDLWEKATRK